jgi:hypothetical protein
VIAISSPNRKTGESAGIARFKEACPVLVYTGVYSSPAGVMRTIYTHFPEHRDSRTTIVFLKA